ncbi:non-hydrolyzing UDP-N-acetylglucosamine 2-epimerase [Kitasatospora purpeofusca]|uniref:non-hydrolyzing UDP-N-acetylglucosamine 2-epimerase n=1 Tax=Kitasatospora purpeofusca TaxID=67352 RepID=UPI0035D6E562
MTLRVGIVYGTRPEAIKIAPLALALAAADGFRPVLVSTGQHLEMVEEINEAFGLRPRYRLKVLRPGRPLGPMAADLVDALQEPLRREELDLVVVQGDTTTAFAAALAATYARIPVVHLEAGLRTGDPQEPFPEEINRRMIAQVAALHLAPTREAAANLLGEGIKPADVVVTGNTVIDALHTILRSPVDFHDPRLSELVAHNGPVVLLTMHRRESWGRPMEEVARAVAELCAARPDLRFVVPLHPNPQVREVFERALGGHPRVLLCGPLPYTDFVGLLHRATLVLTDSGGVQEEAPSLGSPVLVLRDRTERVEGVAAGCAKLIGTDRRRIVAEVLGLLADRAAYEAMRKPGLLCYGDGRAAERSVAAIRERWALPVAADLPAVAGVRAAS